MKVKKVITISPKVLEILEDPCPGKIGENQLADAFDQLARDDKVFARIVGMQKIRHR